jgi:formylglycine-generating enzyme required for sulfatase activity/serine/threonine protein kinase
MADDLDFGATIRGMSPGQKVFGRYTLKKILGRGGMGLVWLAHDEKLDRDIALKFLPELVALDARAVADLKRETRRSLELTHPHIVRIYDFVDDARSAAIAMEWVDGATLSALALDRPHHVFRVAELVPWVKQLTEALTYAHEQARVVHRDLKPANLMIDAAGRLKIADFGISATLADSTTRVSLTASTSGTPLYMSPQQLMGEDPAVTDDIYALGSLLYELLTGKPPFHSGNVILQVQSKVAAPVNERRAALGITGEPVPPAWDETIAACLAKDPAARPQSASEFWDRLEGGDGHNVARQRGDGAPVGSAPQRSGGAPRAGAYGAPEVQKAQKTQKEEKVGRHVPTPPQSAGGVPESKIKNPKSKIPAMAALVAGVAGLAVAGWYFGLHAPEQRRIEAERLAVRQAVLAQERAEQERVAAEREAERQRELAEQEAERQRLAAEQARREAARGGVIVRTIPAGAEVRVGAVALDRSPLTLREQRLGTYPVRIRLEGHEDWDGEITVEENEFTELNVPLERSTGTLALTSEPPGVNFAVNGEVTHTGRTPAQLEGVPTGSYEVTFQRDGWPEQGVSLTVGRGGVARATGNFVGGAISLSSEPAGLAYEVTPATGVTFGPKFARLTGRTPAELSDLPPGRYEVSFQREGWPVQARRVELKRGERASATAEFVPGVIELTSVPSGAEVWSEGRRVGTTPFRVAEALPGSYEYELRLRGYQPATSALTVRARDTTRVEVSLEEIRGPQPGQRFTIPDLGMELMPIPPGSFQMGSARGGNNNERPVTRVTISRPFWLAKTEVTQRQWQLVMGNNPSHFKGEILPVEQVLWDEAMEYCRKLTERERLAGRLQEGYVYTLPTEAQWEYAARAGTTGDYGGTGRLDDMGWYDRNSGHSTKPVGTKGANAWGLHDMHGNVWEWCLDWYGPYPGGSVTDPTGPAPGNRRVLRGGSWGGTAVYCRSAVRGSWEPGLRNSNLGFHLGFRPALTPSR